MGYSTLGVGAGGGPIKLMRFLFKSRSDVIPSVIDLFGRYVTEIDATYITPDGTDHYVNILEDGYYIAQTSTTLMLDAMETYDPQDPTDSEWHELNPTFCQVWRMMSFIDNGDLGLSASDQIDMENIGTGEHVDFHVDEVILPPVPNDGESDILVTVKEPTPEFPLGTGLMIMIAAAIPIMYLWRTRKKEG